MKLSIVIATYKRDEFLLQTLQALIEQDFEDFEIIVASQSEIELEELQSFINQNESRIKLFKQLDKTGAVFNRNLGIEKSTGEIILFLDDDIKPLSKDLLANHARNYNDSLIGGVAGRVEQEDFPQPNEDLKTGYITKTGRFITNFNSKRRQTIIGGISANLSFRRDLLVKIGGFDENYLRGMREESDVCLRIGRFSKIIYDPDAAIFHYAAKSGGMETRNQEVKKKRINWYYNFFHNEMLFFLKFLPKYYLPIFIFYHKLRPILSCMFWYGKGSPEALLTPINAFIGGYKTYRREIEENSIWK